MASKSGVTMHPLWGLSRAHECDRQMGDDRTRYGEMCSNRWNCWRCKNRPASCWGTETWPDLRLQWPQVVGSRLDSGMSTWVDFKRSETFRSCDKLAWALYVYCRLFTECLYFFGGCLLLLSFVERSSYRQLKSVCYVTVFDALRCMVSLASLSSGHLWCMNLANR